MKARVNPKKLRISVLLNESKPRTGGFASNVADVIGGQVACAVVALATEICYARLLGPEGRGQIGLCLMTLALGVLLGGMGGEGTIILWCADSRRRATAWLPAVLLWGLMGCVFTCALWVTLYWRWHPPFLASITSTLAFIVLFSIPASVFFDYQIAMLAGQERFRLRAAVTTAAQAAGLGGFLFLLFFRRSAETALWGNLIGILVAAGIAGIILRTWFREFWKLRPARSNLFPTLSYAMRGQFGLVASFFNYRLDVFIVNYFLHSAQLGFYSLGVVISEALWQIPAAVALALFPRTARTIDEGASEFTCLILRQVLVIAAVGAIAIGVGSWLFLPPIFGERFRPSIEVVWLLLPGTLALSLGRLAASDLAGRGKSEYSSIFSVTALVVTVALDLTLIPRLGIRGAALASSVAYFTNTILLLAALKYELKVTWGALLVPKLTEWNYYVRAWLRLRDWVRPASVVPSGQAD